MALATKTLAVPTAPVASAVPEPLPVGYERHLVTGTAVPEAEAALLSVDPNSDLVFSSVSVDENGHIVSNDDSPSSSLDKRSYMGTCNSCSIVNDNALRCNCRNKAGKWTWSRLDLNQCLVNLNGQLAWRIG